LAEAAEYFAQPLRYGLTTSGGILGGGFPGYNLYRTKHGWLALAALEPHFWQKLGQELGLVSPTQDQLQNIFLTSTAREWETWGAERDLPLAAVWDATITSAPSATPHPDG